MKRVIRSGVFETNSSSTHTLTLISKKDYDADKSSAYPQYRTYGVVATKYDKLLMACGCCEEIFITEKQIDDYAENGDEYCVNRKKEHDELKGLLEGGLGETAYMRYRIMSYELSVGYIIRVYCELTGKSYDKTYDKIVHNGSSRYLHMKFFSEGALYDAELDYAVICDLFTGNETDVLNNIRHYFDDDFVLLYREYYAGIY